MAPQIRSGEYGISRCCTPAALSAFSTALASAGTEPVAPASPAPLAPSTLAGEGTAQSISVMRGARHEIIHEAAGQKLPCVVIVGNVLADDLAKTLHQAAVQLALDQLVIVDRAAVVGGDVIDHGEFAGIGIDLDFGDMRA